MALHTQKTSFDRHSVAGIVRDGSRVFVARRIPGGDMGGKWEFPGGKVESGESDSDALIREYLEEFGVPVRVGKLLASAQFEHRQNRHALRAYEVFFEALDFTLTEHTEWRWIPFRDLGTLEFADSDKKLFTALAPYFEGPTTR